MKKAWLALAPVLFLCFSHPGYTAPKDGAASSESIRREVKDETVEELFDKAFRDYTEGKLTQDAGRRSDKYAAAISAISRAAKLDKYDSDILALASAIYRAKGGSSMARKYFAEAEDVLLTRIYDDSDDIGANLDYAILCYAGEPRYGEKYEKYLKLAKEHAQKVIKLTEKRAKKGDAPCARVMGLAYLVMGDAKRCGSLLKYAAKTDAASRFYSDLFYDTVSKGRWLWPVGKDSVAREFLLYSLTDTARYAKVQPPARGWIRQLEVGIGRSFGF